MKNKQQPNTDQTPNNLTENTEQTDNNQNWQSPNTMAFVALHSVWCECAEPLVSVWCGIWCCIVSGQSMAWFKKPAPSLGDHLVLGC